MNRVAVDIDETLVHFLPNLAKYHKRSLPPGKYSYVYRNIFNIPEYKSRKMVMDFYKSEEFHNLKPIVGARKKLEELRQSADKIYVVSGRQDCVRKSTELWLNTYFPDIFDDLVLTNSYTVDEIPKVEIYRSLNIDTMIDDDYKVCLESLRNGVKPYNYIHFPEYPWTDITDMSLFSWYNLEIK